MIELKLDTSPGLGNKPYYFTNPKKADWGGKGMTDHMTYNQSQLVKKALNDVDIQVLDRTL